MIAPVPLFDCRLDDQAVEIVRAVFESGQLASGPKVAELERQLSERLGGRPIVAMSDSTHALALALQLSGVARGDEVLTLAYNCLSSNSAITQVGATPVWLDLDPGTATVALADCDAALTPRTRALVVYHVAGYPAPLTALRRWCDEHGLPLIEDANNALGASASGRAAGSVGDFAVLSFYPNRQLNAIEGAALVCPGDEAADRARRLRRFGIDVSRFRDRRGEIDPAADVPLIGMSAPLNHVHASLALHHLGTLDERLLRLRAHVEWLGRQVADLEGVRPVGWAPGDSPAFWVWLVRCRHRDATMAHLKSLGVGCSTLHQPNDTYSGFGARPRPLPGTRRFMDEVLALPSGWWLGPSDLERVVEALRTAPAN